MNKKTYTAPEAEIEKFTIHCDDLLSGGLNSGEIIEEPEDDF